ncbi:MAG: hypothetical protein AAF962_23115 [Actinomycetota bacterium]
MDLGGSTSEAEATTPLHVRIKALVKPGTGGAIEAVASVVFVVSLSQSPTASAGFLIGLPYAAYRASMCVLWWIPDRFFRGSLGRLLASTSLVVASVLLLGVVAVPGGRLSSLSVAAVSLAFAAVSRERAFYLEVSEFGAGVGQALSWATGAFSGMYVLALVLVAALAGTTSLSPAVFGWTLLALAAVSLSELVFRSSESEPIVVSRPDSPGHLSFAIRYRTIVHAAINLVWGAAFVWVLLSLSHGSPERSVGALIGLIVLEVCVVGLSTPVVRMVQGRVRADKSVGAVGARLQANALIAVLVLAVALAAVRPESWYVAVVLLVPMELARFASMVEFRHVEWGKADDGPRPQAVTRGFELASSVSWLLGVLVGGYLFSSGLAQSVEAPSSSSAAFPGRGLLLALVAIVVVGLIYVTRRRVSALTSARAQYGHRLPVSRSKGSLVSLSLLSSVMASLAAFVLVATVRSSSALAFLLALIGLAAFSIGTLIARRWSTSLTRELDVEVGAVLSLLVSARPGARTAEGGPRSELLKEAMVGLARKHED